MTEESFLEGRSQSLFSRNVVICLTLLLNMESIYFAKQVPVSFHNP